MNVLEEYLHNAYFRVQQDIIGERRMEEEMLLSINQANCRHWESRKYSQRSFDILNGFELAAKKCCNCHKILELTIRKMK
jgi:hypothetical protein